MPELAQSEEWVGPNAAVPPGMERPPSEAERAREQRELAGRRVRAGGAFRRPQRGDRWRLTADDEALLAGLTRFGVASWRQCAWRYYGEVRRTTGRRVGYMREAELLRSARDSEWAGRVLWPRQAGTSVVEGRLQVPVSAPQQHPGERLLHRLAVTDAGFRFELRGDHVLAERELRVCEANEGMAERIGSALGVSSLGSSVAVDPAGRRRTRYFAVPVGSEGSVHYPDLIVAHPSGLVAIEVEVTPKPTYRLKQNLRGYAANPVFQQVVWFATATVAVQLHGYRSQDTGEWVPGALQQVGLLPAGKPHYTDESPVRVVSFSPYDPGVAYQLDMRQIPDSWWLPRSEWTDLRAKWAADEEFGKPAKVPFLRWWRGVWMPREHLAAAQSQMPPTS